MKTASLVIVVVPLFFLAPRAEALSCRALEDRYFFECATDGCRPLFRAFQVATEPCRRHFVTSPIPEWAGPRLLEMLAERPAADPAGVFELRTRASFVRGAPNSDQRLQKDLDSFKALSRSSEAVAGLRAHWDARADREQAANRMWLAMDWIVVVGVLGVIGYSVRTLLRHVSRPRPNSARAIAIALSTQFALLVLGILGLWWFVPRTIVLVTSLVWIMELPIVAWLAVRRQGAAERGVAADEA